MPDEPRKSVWPFGSVRSRPFALRDPSFAEDGQTAMHMAAFTGAGRVVQFLADSGANVDVQDGHGETPWSMAAGLSPVLRYRGGVFF